MSQTETNTKYKEIKKLIADADYYVDEVGAFVSTISDGAYDIGVISHRETIEVIVDSERSPRHAKVIYQMAKDVGIPCKYSNNLHDRVTDTQLKNLSDEIISLKEKLTQQITV